MDPRDVNRINYNNYYVGQNLDFLIRSKMRSESLSTPLTNTPVFYDDQVSSKMALLGKRGFYDPGYIYGFDDQRVEKRENINNQNNKSPPKYPPYNINEREQYMNNPKDNFTQEQYDLEMMRRRQEMQRKEIEREREGINPEQYNNMREKDYNMRNEPNQYGKSNINEMIPKKYDEQNINNNYRNNKDFQREYNDYLNREGMIEQKEQYRGSDQLNLPKTREQIQHDVYIENFKRQQLAKQMMMEDEMKYRQQYYK